MFGGTLLRQSYGGQASPSQRLEGVVPLTIHIDDDALQKFREKSIRTEIYITYKDYVHSAPISQDLRQSLLEDLEE